MEGNNSNRQAQEEERLALTSIFTEDFLREIETGGKDQIAYRVRFSIELGEHFPKTTAVFTVHLPPTYPRIEPPVYELKEAYGEPPWITDAHLAMLKSELQDIFDATAETDNVHGVVLFEWIEWLRDWLESSWRTHLDQHPESISRHLIEEQRISEEMASISFQQSAAALDGYVEGNVDRYAREETLELTNLPPVFHSKEPLVDRKSVFVAHIAPVTSVGEVERVKQYLLSNSKIARATHNILAYRIVQHRKDGGNKHAIDGEVTISDCDDDGENAAGGRLLHLLEVCKCRNVMVVVSRWYGGTLLGPDRFKHINNVARELLNAHGFIA